MNEIGKLAIRRDEDNVITNIKVSIPIATRETEGFFSVYAPSFNTFGYSKESEADAINDFENSLKVFFEVHIQRGTLREAIEFYGWEQTGIQYLSKESRKVSTERVLNVELMVPMAA